MQISSKFAQFESSNNIWAIGSIHSHLKSFEKIKKHIEENFIQNDKIVFLGNVIGVGEFAKETLSSVIDMRFNLMSNSYTKGIPVGIFSLIIFLSIFSAARLRKAYF